jgi:subtilase family serine protease
VNAPRGPHFRALAASACGLLAIAGLAAAGSARASAGPASAASTGRTSLAGSHPAWAVPARMVAAPDAAASVSVRMYLAGRDPAGLADYAAAVSDPASPTYRKFLTPGQELRRFGPTAAQVTAIRSWLASAGLRVTAVTRHYVAASGSVPAAQSAFAVRLARFRAPGGSVAMAPEEDASVPDAVRPAVLTVTGLDTSSLTMRPTLAGTVAASTGAASTGAASTGPASPPAFYTADPCSQYYGQRMATSKPKAYGKRVPWAMCGYTPQQLRSAYGATGSTSSGSGVTVAVVDAYSSPTMPADASTYAKAEHFQQLTAGQFTAVPSSVYDDQSECDPGSWYEEESLDVEAVHTMAPDADIEYIAAQDCTFGPLLDALSDVVDNHLADIVSDSWTGSEQGLNTSVTSVFDQVFEQGTAEGISFDFASGDCGYNAPATGCGKSQEASKTRVNFPTSSPWVTGVGGTSLAIGKKGNYEWETGWGDMVVPQRRGHWKSAPPGPFPADYLFGGGGGTSVQFSQPSWQAGVVPKSLARTLPGGQVSAHPMREVPDVALDADPATGFLFGETVRLRDGKSGFMLSRIGGTSLSCPLFAGLEADVAQAAGTDQLGLVDPLLYKLAGTRAFHDVTDHPLGRGTRIALARNEWAKSATGTGGLRTSLYTLGTDGSGAAALDAGSGYDDVTGLGSPTALFVTDLADTIANPLSRTGNP